MAKFTGGLYELRQVENIGGYDLEFKYWGKPTHFSADILYYREANEDYANLAADYAELDAECTTLAHMLLLWAKRPPLFTTEVEEAHEDYANLAADYAEREAETDWLSAKVREQSQLIIDLYDVIERHCQAAQNYLSPGMAVSAND